EHDEWHERVRRAVLDDEKRAEREDAEADRPHGAESGPPELGGRDEAEGEGGDPDGDRERPDGVEAAGTARAGREPAPDEDGRRETERDGRPEHGAPAEQLGEGATEEDPGEAARAGRRTPGA